jgi:hypothetical protein
MRLPQRSLAVGLALVLLASAALAQYVPGANDTFRVSSASGQQRTVNAASYIQATAGGTGSGTFTVNPTALGSLDHVTIGATTPAAITGTAINGTSYRVAGVLVGSSTAPAIASGFGTSPSVVASNGTFAFTINVGTSNTGTGVLTLPAAVTGWACSATDTTTVSTTVTSTHVVPTSTTSVTFQNYTDVSGTHAWVDADVLSVQCAAY